MTSYEASLTMPIAIEDIDARWLTEALSSVLPEGVEVESFAVETIGTGIGLMGLLYRLTIEYRNATGHPHPATVVVKLPVLIDATRQVALAYRFYEKEVAFYRELAVDTALRTPDLYYGAHDLATDNFVLVLEDVGHLRAADQVAGCTRADAIAAMSDLARHHAAFWDDARFATDELAWLPFGSDAPIPEGVVQALGGYWQPFVDFMGADLRPEIQAVGEWLPGAARYLLSVPAGQSFTVSHGDYRLDNLFFDENGAVTALDWQIATKQVGGYDFAYFVSQSLTADSRRSYLDELVATYLGTLAECGVTYPEDEFWFDVRRTLLFGLMYPVQCMALDLSDERSAALVRELADRASSAIIEMGALRLLES